MVLSHYETRKTLFHHISKNREQSSTYMYNAQHSIIDKLQGSNNSSCKEKTDNREHISKQRPGCHFRFFLNLMNYSCCEKHFLKTVKSIQTPFSWPCLSLLNSNHYLEFRFILWIGTVCPKLCYDVKHLLFWCFVILATTEPLCSIACLVHIALVFWDSDYN